MKTNNLTPLPASSHLNLKETQVGALVTQKGSAVTLNRVSLAEIQTGVQTK